jgi:hypothetical protein
MLCLLLVGRRMKRKANKNKKEEEKEKREAARGFFSKAGARFTLLAVPGRIFVAFRCNKG